MGFGPDAVLKTASLEKYLNQSEVPSNSQLSHGYGLGFMVSRRDDYIAFGHGGAIPATGRPLHEPRRGHRRVVLANALGPGTVDTEDIALQSLDLLSK